MLELKKKITFLSSMADGPETTSEKKLEHSCLIYMGVLMSMGGLLWGSTLLLVGLPYESVIPFAYVLITFFNFTYLNFSKDFQTVRAFQVLISLFLPFLFQFLLGGFVASGAVVWWSLLAILSGFAYQDKKTNTGWFVVYIVLIILSALFDEEAKTMGVKVPPEISTLFFTINIIAVSTIIYTLFFIKKKAK